MQHASEFHCGEKHTKERKSARRGGGGQKTAENSYKEGNAFTDVISGRAVKANVSVCKVQKALCP